MNKPLIDQMVDRFLGWKIPADFSPDCGIAFTPIPNASPVGTNLLTAVQAKAMLEHVLGDTLCRFYRADGTFEVLASPEDVTKRRIECAKTIQAMANQIAKARDIVLTSPDTSISDEVLDALKS